MPKRPKCGLSSNTPKGRIFHIMMLWKKLSASVGSMALDASIDADRYMHRFSPRKLGSKWSKLNKERAQHMLKVGQMVPAGEKSIELAKKNGRWTEPVSARTSFSMPPELNERLKRNNKVETIFESLAPSYQRQYVAWIATAKRSETQKRRLDEAIELLTHSRPKLSVRNFTMENHKWSLAIET